MLRYHLKILIATLLLLCGATAHAAAPQTEKGPTTEDVTLAMEALRKVAQGLNAELTNKPAEAIAFRKAAIADYDTYLSRNPNDAAVLNARASIKERVEKGTGRADYEKVIAVTSEKISSNAGDSRNLGLRADAYSSLGMYDNAKNDYTAAIAISNDEEKRQYTSKLAIMEIEAKQKK